MDSTRQNKFGRLIQKELGELFQREGADFYGRAFVTITVVRMSPDMGVAKVYLSLLAAKDKERDEFLAKIRGQSKEIRKRLGARIKGQVRHIPELYFFIDDSLDYVEKMEKLFKGIKDPKEKE
jgi:ribosome-binding factor A